MFRSEMPRIYELRDRIADPSSPDAYFQNFEQNCQNSPHHVKQIYLGWEKEFDALDGAAWDHLKAEAAPHLIRKNRERHWEPLFDILSQAPAYNYLNRCGCTGIHFIPRSKRKTPDLGAVLDGRKILCEVKCINISDDEIRARRGITARSIPTHLSEGFFNKLRSQITQALSQMKAYDSSGQARRLVYLNPQFDDRMGDCKHLYFPQIDAYLLANPTPGVDLVFYNDRTPIYRPLTMTAATVDNGAD
jgi:hypothetical protein